MCTGLVGPRSYEDGVYRCNRRQLLHADEPSWRALLIEESQPNQPSVGIYTPADTRY